MPRNGNAMSPRITRSSPQRKMLEGLIDPCTIPFACSGVSARRSWRRILMI